MAIQEKDIESLIEKDIVLLNPNHFLDFTPAQKYLFEELLHQLSQTEDNITTHANTKMSYGQLNFTVKLTHSLYYYKSASKKENPHRYTTLGSREHGAAGAQNAGIYKNAKYFALRYNGEVEMRYRGTKKIIKIIPVKEAHYRNVDCPELLYTRGEYQQTEFFWFSRNHDKKSQYFLGLIQPNLGPMNLSTYLTDQSKYPNTLLFRYAIAINIITWVKQFHDKDIIHCDIKSDNIIVNEYTALCDFGLSTEAGKTSRAFTPCYAAPELLIYTKEYSKKVKKSVDVSHISKENSYNSKKSDVYSLAIVLLEMFSLEVPEELHVFPQNLYEHYEKFVAFYSSEDYGRFENKIKSRLLSILKPYLAVNPEKREEDLGALLGLFLQLMLEEILYNKSLEKEKIPFFVKNVMLNLLHEKIIQINMPKELPPESVYYAACGTYDRLFQLKKEGKSGEYIFDVLLKDMQHVFWEKEKLPFLKDFDIFEENLQQVLNDFDISKENLPRTVKAALNVFAEGYVDVETLRKSQTDRVLHHRDHLSLIQRVKDFVSFLLSLKLSTQEITLAMRELKDLLPSVTLKAYERRLPGMTFWTPADRRSGEQNHYTKALMREELAFVKRILGVIDYYLVEGEMDQEGLAAFARVLDAKIEKAKRELANFEHTFFIIKPPLSLNESLPIENFFAYHVQLYECVKGNKSLDVNVTYSVLISSLLRIGRENINMREKLEKAKEVYNGCCDEDAKTRIENLIEDKENQQRDDGLDYLRKGKQAFFSANAVKSAQSAPNILERFKKFRRTLSSSSS